MSAGIKLPEEYATELTGGPGALLRQFSFESSADARAFHQRIRDIFARCQREAIEACAQTAELEADKQRMRVGAHEGYKWSAAALDDFARDIVRVLVKP